MLYLIIQLIIRLGHAYYLYSFKDHRLPIALLAAFHRSKVVQLHLLELHYLVDENNGQSIEE